MKILIDIGHPAHVHFFKNAAWKLIEQGHQIFFTARDKDVTISLLDHYKFPYKILTPIGKGKLGRYQEFIKREWALKKLIDDYQPDVMTEISGDFIAPIGALLGIPTMVYSDTEVVPNAKYIVYPFASSVFTPACFLKNIGNKQVRYSGYHELAYLSPNYFTPDVKVLKEIGINQNEPYTILRFVAWEASHDVGQMGFSAQDKLSAIQTFQEYGKVFITSEKQLPKEFESYRINLSPHQMHDLMSFAQLVIGEGATMATEAAILGTPSIYISSIAPRLGNFRELMDKYELVFSYSDPNQAVAKAREILKQPDSKNLWNIRRNKMLSETIDVSELIVDSLLNNQKYIDGYYHGKIISSM